MTRPVKVAYLFTTFPVATETFLQREVRAMRELGLDFDLYSLWGGADEFEGIPVRRFSKWKLAAMPWRKLQWFIRRPGAYWRLTRAFFGEKPPSLLNFGENILGFAFAFIYADFFRGEKYDLVHAVWAGAPAAAACLISRLTGIPFSTGAHAYDVFEDGGDWFLKMKLRGAALVHTSSEATRSRLIELGAPPNKTVMIRRGLDRLPPLKEKRREMKPLRLLSAGRLIEKKGHLEQLEIYAGLRDAGISFEARIIGAGPLAKRLREHRRRLNLERRVYLVGALPFAEVPAQFAWADIFIYTGKVAASGDRDGLPNVVPEAMAYGVPVVCAAAGGLPEAIENEKTGIILDSLDPALWISAIRKLASNDSLYENLRRGARAWAGKNFNARKNAARLFSGFQKAAGRANPARRQPVPDAAD